jgi:Family of unknown function (DUF5522)
MDEPRDEYLDEPLTSRLRDDHPLREVILERHRKAVDRGLSTYLDPATGYTVLTAQYLADRGYCCNSGCRHCPY